MHQKTHARVSARSDRGGAARPRTRGAARNWVTPVAAALAVAALALSGCAQASTTPAANDSAAQTEETETVARPAAPEGELPTEFQAQLQEALERTMAEDNVPGAAAGVWIPEEGSWTAAAGLADIEEQIAVTTDMSWPIRSITKSYTVTLLLQLVADGTLNLDDTISEYVDGVTNGDRITLLQLANMSSGVAEYANEAFFAEFMKDPTHVYSLEELNAAALGEPEQFAPGTEYVYTNTNTNLLGAVIEAATGQEYADVLAERILKPLGQSGTHYILDVEEWTEPHAVGYQPDPETQHMSDSSQHTSILGAAGALVSTLDDGRVWATTLGSGALITPKLQEQRQAGHPIERPPYDLYAVGMGETGGWVGHNGEGLGFTAATFYRPETGASIVVYMNASNIPDRSHPADQAFRALAAVLADSGL
ncbi:MAG: serine hydrolase domain-containing protein [Leucobacter sp.]